MYSVADFASQKGISVSRVRQLVAAGDIPSERVGNLVVIPARAAGWRPRSRRPLSDRMAAALLDALSGSLPEVSPKELSRVRAHLVLMHSSPHPAVVLSDLLASRSRRQSFSAHPDDLKDLKSDKRLKLSGASLPEFQLSPGSSLDAYVAPVDIEGVVRE
ncbi:MerR family transcriptional regulator, partial [Leucobacter sp. BZR 635]